MEYKVGISDYKVVTNVDTLITIGLGSCVGIALYDGRVKVAGLAHIMLPNSANFKDSTNICKFADTCIPAMIKDMEKRGAVKSRLRAKICGGSNMFNMAGETVGEKNYIAVIEVLKNLNIPLDAKDVGGNVGRTMRVEASTGQVFMKKIGTQEVILK